MFGLDPSTEKGFPFCLTTLPLPCTEGNSSLRNLNVKSQIRDLNGIRELETFETKISPTCSKTFIFKSTDEVVLDLNVFGAIMEFRIKDHPDGAVIVAME